MFVSRLKSDESKKDALILHIFFNCVNWIQSMFYMTSTLSVHTFFHWMYVCVKFMQVDFFTANFTLHFSVHLSLKKSALRFTCVNKNTIINLTMLTTFLLRIVKSTDSLWLSVCFSVFRYSTVQWMPFLIWNLNNSGDDSKRLRYKTS